MADKTNEVGKALIHYWDLKYLAGDQGWIMDDGIGNDIRAYARLALQVFYQVENPQDFIPE